MILQPPQMHLYQPSVAEQDKISKYFAEVYHCPWSHIEPILPITMALWGKVCIANRGDKIQSSSTVSESKLKLLVIPHLYGLVLLQLYN